ncbi:MAG TPA: GNAT family protein [Ignavibacteria bacterium]|nr:GNAT family protein [Ignavibacteria bacterium]
MKLIKFNDLTDYQFRLYMDLITKIRNKYRENTFVLDYDWNEYRDYFFRVYSDFREFKESRIRIIEDGSRVYLNEYILFKEENPVAFIAYKRVSGKRYEFIFDTEFTQLDDDICKMIFKVLNSFFENTEAKQIFYLANRKSDIEVFSNYGIEITENIVTSKLLKKDMDIEKLKCIVNSNEYAKNLDLKLFRKIPEEIFERYIDYMNDILKAKEHYNPDRYDFVKYKKEDLLRSIEIDEEDGDPMYMYMLFENENIAGSCKIYIEKEDDSVFIQHCGGLTGVAENYRGKGLAMYLKAGMYLKISEEYPGFRHAVTDTYPWNKYMFRINEELGFRIFYEGSIFKFTKSNTEKN